MFKTVKTFGKLPVGLFLSVVALEMRWLYLWVGPSKSTQVDLGFSSQVKLVCNSVTVGISWHRRFHYKSFKSTWKWLFKNIFAPKSLSITVKTVKQSCISG